MFYPNALYPKICWNLPILNIWEYPAIPGEMLAEYYDDGELLPINPQLEELYPFLKAINGI